MIPIGWLLGMANSPANPVSARKSIVLPVHLIKGAPWYSVQLGQWNVSLATTVQTFKGVKQPSAFYWKLGDRLLLRIVRLHQMNVSTYLNVPSTFLQLTNRCSNNMETLKSRISAAEALPSWESSPDIGDAAPSEAFVREYSKTPPMAIAVPGSRWPQSPKS